jgi:hypothetical protein
LDVLRELTWTASAGKDGNIPSIGVLLFHFLRAALILRIWGSACTGWMTIPDIKNFGIPKGLRVRNWSLYTTLKGGLDGSKSK